MAVATIRCTALTETEIGMVARRLLIPRDHTVAEMRAEIEAHRQDGGVRAVADGGAAAEDSRRPDG